MKSQSRTTDEPKIAAPPLIGSCRLSISLVCLLVSFASILLTINLPMAIVCMNRRSQLPVNETQEINCTLTSKFVVTENSTLMDETQEQEMYLDKPAQGMLLGGLYYGVVSVQLLVGWLCDKYRKNKMQIIMGTGILSFASIISPVVLESAGVPYYLALRIVKGIAMSFALSSMLPLLTHWTTTTEQGLLVGIATTGVGIANAVTFPISGLLCKYSGWKSIFYFGGICGLVATLFTIFLIYDSPRNHPRINAEEKQYLLPIQPASQTSKKNRVIPWKKFATSLPVWAVVVTHFFFFAVVKGTVLNLPIFVKEVLNFTVTENGVFSAMPLVGALILHMVAGPMFDYVRRKNIFSTTTVRKLFQLIGTLLPATLMFISSQLTPEYKYIIIAMITVGYSLTEFAVMGGYWYNMMDLAPDYVGILQGINKTIGLAPGFIIPAIISALTPDGTSEEWSYVFVLFGGLYLASFIFYVMFGSANLQKWGKAKAKQDTNTIEPI